MASLNLLKDKEKKVFYHYLIPSICSTLVNSIYILVDTLIIGQGVGAKGITALNIFLPFFSLYMGIGLMFGIGSGILMSKEDGVGNKDKSNKYFATSVIGVSLVAIILTLVSVFKLKDISYMLGANKNSIDLVMEYGKCIAIATPVFIATNFLGPIVRNKKNPNLAMIAVLVGAGLNIVLDYIFVFPMHMGMKGAAIATVIGSFTTSTVLLTHFIKKENRIKISMKIVSFDMVKDILACGSSSFFIELASGFVIFIFNLQLLKYLGDNAIVVYGIISNCMLVATSLFNGVGQATQPIISTNHGANEIQRVRNIVKYALYTTIAIGLVLFLGVFIFTKEIILVFVNANNSIINMGIPAIRTYLSAFCLMNINILMCNYFQSVGKEKLSMKISIIRGFLLNIILVMIMPVILGGSSLWLVVPMTEIITFIGMYVYIIKVNNLNYKLCNE